MTFAELRPVDEALVAELVRQVITSADIAEVTAPAGSTSADRSRLGVAAAFRCALANGLITAAPQDEWPQWIGFPEPEAP